MRVPMAVLDMVPVEADKEAKADPSAWAWNPQLKGGSPAAEALKPGRRTNDGSPE